MHISPEFSGSARFDAGSVEQYPRRKDNLRGIYSGAAETDPGEDSGNISDDRYRSVLKMLRKAEKIKNIIENNGVSKQDIKTLTSESKLSTQNDTAQLQPSNEFRFCSNHVRVINGSRVRSSFRNRLSHPTKTWHF